MSLEIRDVHKNYSQGSQSIAVLQGLSAKIEEGEIVAVIGQSGSGKSTLLALLAGLDHPTSGTVLLRGEAIEKKSPEEMSRWRGKNIGIVFQQYHLLPHLTAQENVELPLEILGLPNRAQIANQLLKDLGLGHRLDHLPRQLSGGECQRVAIARALATSPNLLLADEPSGNLDSDTGDKVMESFFSQVRKLKTTTILVTHNQELAARCDRKFMLNHGQLKEV